jgi:membrane protein
MTSGLPLFHRAVSLVKESVMSFIADDALSKGASIAFYTAISIAPVLVIVIAIAGLAFGHEAARGAISAQFSGLMGTQSADLLQTAIHSASGTSSGVIATSFGLLALLVTASGVFGEMQSTLNAIWKVPPQGGTITHFMTITRLMKARAASLGLVAALGFLLLVSLVISAVLSAAGTYINAYIPFGHLILSMLNFVISFLLTSVLFAAIYKILPDTPLAWRDVMVGAVVTAFLFEIGKSLIGLYIGSSAIVSSYGAAGGLIILLLWIYYSAQIFLLGAEFTKTYARRDGGQQTSAVALPPAGRAPGDTIVEASGTPSPLLHLMICVVLIGVWAKVLRQRKEECSARQAASPDLLLSHPVEAPVMMIRGRI